MNKLPSFVNGKFILCIYSGVLYVVGPCATASALKHQCTGTGQVQPIIGKAYHRLLITNIFTSSLFAGNVHTSGLLWLYPNGDIVFRDQECRVFKEKGRKVDCSDWDFEEPQVRMVKCTVCKKEIMVVLSLLGCVSLTLVNFPPGDFDHFTPYFCQLSPLRLTLLPPVK